MHMPAASSRCQQPTCWSRQLPCRGDNMCHQAKTMVGIQVSVLLGCFGS